MPRMTGTGVSYSSRFPAHAPFKLALLNLKFSPVESLAKRPLAPLDRVYDSHHRVAGSSTAGCRSSPSASPQAILYRQIQGHKSGADYRAK